MAEDEGYSSSESEHGNGIPAQANADDIPHLAIPDMDRPAIRSSDGYCFDYEYSDQHRNEYICERERHEHPPEHEISLEMKIQEMEEHLRKLKLECGEFIKERQDRLTAALQELKETKKTLKRVNHRFEATTTEFLKDLHSFLPIVGPKSQGYQQPVEMLNATNPFELDEGIIWVTIRDNMEQTRVKCRPMHCFKLINLLKNKGLITYHDERTAYTRQIRVFNVTRDRNFQDHEFIEEDIIIDCSFFKEEG